MFVAGSYILKGSYFHVPFDCLFCKKHHTAKAERVSLYGTLSDVSLGMAMVHGLIRVWIRCIRKHNHFHFGTASTFTAFCSLSWNTVRIGNNGHANYLRRGICKAHSCQETY